MRIVPVRSDILDQWIPLIEWHLAQFCADGGWHPNDLVDQIRDRTRQLWVASDGTVKAALLTQIADDKLATCRITHLVGVDRDSWLHLFGAIEGWARELGCQRIEAIARPGWERAAKPLGMTKTHIVLEKRL